MDDTIYDEDGLELNVKDNGIDDYEMSNDHLLRDIQIWVYMNK